MTTVVNLYKQPYDVYIGRANKKLGLPESKWHNPFHIGKDGTREEVIWKYIEYLESSGLLNDIHELKDKVLGCYCKPNACHGDILAYYANEL